MILPLYATNTDGEGTYRGFAYARIVSLAAGCALNSPLTVEQRTMEL